MTRTVLISIAVVASLFVAACGSEDTANESTSASSAAAESTAAAEATSAELAADTDESGQTVIEYLEENGITRTHILANTPDVPQPDITLPAGWTDGGGDGEKIWGTIALTGTKDTPDPSVILLTYSKFNGPVDPAKILELAPNTVLALPDHAGPETAAPLEISGFDAVTISGTGTEEGKPVFVGTTAIVIPRQDGIYEILFMAKGPVAQEAAITQAMSVLNTETKIQP